MQELYTGLDELEGILTEQRFLVSRPARKRLKSFGAPTTPEGVLSVYEKHTMLHIRFHVEKHRLVKYLTTRTETNIKPYHTDHAKSNPNPLIADPQTHYSAPAITVGT